jgi:hypothetical protein
MGNCFQCMTVLVTAISVLLDNRKSYILLPLKLLSELSYISFYVKQMYT